LIKRRGKWYWLDLRIDGKRVRQSLKTTEQGLAIAKAKELQDKLLARSGGRVRLDEFSTKYLEWAWASKPASAKREEQRLLKIESFFIQNGIQYLTDITPYHVEQLKADLRSQGKSPATTNRYLQILRCVFYRAIDWEDYSKPNPVKKVRFYREEPERRLLTHDEVKRIIEAAEAIATRPHSHLQRVFPDMIRLALNTGLRKSELLNLRWSDVRGDEITVKGKGERTRTVPLNDEARQVIERQPQRWPRIFGGPELDATGIFYRTVEAIGKDAGVDWYFHLLRHFFSSSLLARGVDIVTTAALLGHSRLTTTLIYSHTDEGRKKEAVKILASPLGTSGQKAQP
jgi:integrase